MPRTFTFYIDDDNRRVLQKIASDENLKMGNLVRLFLDYSTKQYTSNNFKIVKSGIEKIGEESK